MQKPTQLVLALEIVLEARKKFSYGFPLKLYFDSFLYENPHLTLAYALRHTHLLPSQWTHYAEQIRVFCIYRCSLL